MARVWMISVVTLLTFPNLVMSKCHVCSGQSNGSNRPKRQVSNPSVFYGNRDYYLGVLLASKAGTIFDYEKVLPGIEIAVEKANTYILPSVNSSFKVMKASYGTSCLPDGATGKAAEFVRDVDSSKLVALVGPACSDALDHVARLSAYLNISIITGLGDERQFADKTHFATLTRFAYCQCRVRRVISAMMDQFNWTHVAILYDMNDYFSQTIGQSIDVGLREPVIGARLNVTPFVQSFESQLAPNYETLLKRASEEARIFVLSVTGDVLRSIMLTASRLGMTKGEWVFIDVELFPSYMFGNKHWRRNDSEDAAAREAYRSLIRIAISENKTSPVYKEFAREVMNRSEKAFGPGVFQPGEEVNFFIGAFHDAVIILAQVLIASIRSGDDPLNGFNLRTYFRNWWTSEYLVTGSIHISDRNDRDTAYLYLDMNKDTGEFQAVAQYDALLGGFNPVENRVIDWPGNQPPLDVPKCGFRQDSPACKSEHADYLQWVTIGALGAALCAMVAIFIFYKRRKEKQLFMQSNWRIGWESLTKRPIMATTSMRSLSSLDSNRPNTSSGRSVGSSNTQTQSRFHTEVALYQGQYVTLKRCTFISEVAGQSLESDKVFLTEMNKWKNMAHDNIVRVVGACVDIPNQCLVTEYCMRGSVDDLIHNEKFDMDRQFQLSILNDIASGILHMHKSLHIAHGRLSSSNCLVDARFVVKLADWHMSCLARPDQSQHKTEEKMLYLAPETLFQGRRSPQSDVFAFGITALEVIKKEQPYSTERETMEISTIVKKVRDDTNPFFRPDMKGLGWDSMQKLIMSCLEDEPGSRPTALEILNQLKAENKGKRLNILENLLMRMEQYTANLESMVQERTAELMEEKKKMQSLLFELLPQPVAIQLIETGHVTPEAYDSVTIYFSDIVGFTSLSAESSPMEVVNLLNALYTCFDDILSNLAVYKVETIGDAYMVVSGLPYPNGIEHARQISRMALALLTAVQSFKVPHKPNHILKLRIGLHSGPCVAGVVGLRMPRYCLFGDTVNTASRMESNGEALKIHVSSATKCLLDTFGTFEVKERGEVEMKGKGIQRTYWLLSETQETQATDLV